jgi:hypothetical protein
MGHSTHDILNNFELMLDKKSPRNQNMKGVWIWKFIQTILPSNLYFLAFAIMFAIEETHLLDIVTFHPNVLLSI